MLAFVAERAGAINRLVLMNSEGYWSGARSLNDERSGRAAQDTTVQLATTPGCLRCVEVGSALV